jgi:hypothetical protein
MWWLFAFRMFADYFKRYLRGGARPGKVRLAGTADTLKGGTDEALLCARGLLAVAAYRDA